MKHFIEIDGLPLLVRCIQGLKSVPGVSPIVATSTEHFDDPIENLCRKEQIDCLRGSLNDVFGRTVDVLKRYPFEYFFRVNGDTPILFPELFFQAMAATKERPYDIVTNICPRTFPYGVSIELIKSSTFLRIYVNDPLSDLQKEHITSYFYENKGLFEIFNIENTTVPATDYRFTIDEPEDVAKISYVFKMSDLKDHPTIENLNNFIKLLKNA